MQKMDLQLEALVGIQKSAATYTRHCMLMSLDASFNTGSVKQAVDLLGKDPYAIPVTTAERRSLLDFADWAATASALARLQPDIVQEKYGAFLERLLANPCVQDEMLRNPARWRSVVAVGQTVAGQPVPGAIDHAHCKEARAFLRDFVGESSKCNSTFSKAVNVGGLENARRVMGTLAPSTVGPGCDGLWVYCEYTQRRLGLRAAEKLE
jgi:hypothetical protein